MKWGMVIFTLLMSVFALANSDEPMTLALNEPDQLHEQRQAAVARLKKLLEQKRLGITPIAELPVATQKVQVIKKPVEKAVKIKQPPKPTKQVKREKKETPVLQRKIAVVAWGGELIDDHHFERLMSDQRLARYMVGTMSASLDEVLHTKNHYTKVTSSDWTNSILYEGDDNSQSQRACRQYKVEKLVVVAFSRYATSGAADVILFDCTNGLKKADSFDLDTTVNERYYLEKDFIRILSEFYKGNIGILS